MSLYTDASLIMYPSGYKEDKIYSLKPTDGSGDLTFTRASTATRVNADGLIETSPVNLVEYSEDFSNAFWGVDSGSITANSTTAPNGTTTADTFTRTSSTAYLYNGSFNLVIGQFTQSIYAKANASSSIRLEFVTASFGRGAACIFDLSNGTAGTLTIYGGVSGFTATIESVGDGWYRCSIGGTITIADTYFWELSITSGSVYLWGAQINIGATAKPYFPTTDRLNVPRIDYTGGGCGKLLLEPQRTNNVLYSEQIDNAYWLKYQCSITANQAISPDGTQNADLFTATASGDNVIYRSGLVTRVLSYFVKAGTLSAGTKFYIAVDGVGNANWNQDGTINSQTGGTATNGVSYGNGWYRFTFIVGAGSVANFGLSNSTSGDTLFIYGIQAEEGTYVSSYIPTLASSVTRLADTASKTGISSLIGQTQGTLFFEYPNFNSDYNQGLIGIDDGSGNNRILFYSDSNNRITAQVRTNGVTQQPASYSVSGNVKVAIGYNSSSFVFYVNGTLRFTGTAVVFSNTMSALTFNHVGVGGSITNQAIVFPTRLTNTQLESLTSL